MRSCTFIILLALALGNAAGAQQIIIDDFRLYHPGGGVRNLIDPETMVVDAWRGEFFIASATKPCITAVSAYTREPVRTLTAETGVSSSVYLLASDPVNRRLLCTSREGFPRNAILSAMDALSGAIAVQSDLGPCTRLQVIPDTKRGVIYATTGREHILILSLSSLAIIDSLAFEAPCGGLAFDSSHSELYASQAEPVFGISTIKKYNTANRQRIRTIQFAATEPVDRVECDPSTGNLLAFSAGVVHAFDGFGNAAYEYNITGDIGASATSPQYRRAYLCDVRGRFPGGRAGFAGRVHIFGFTGIEVDSMDFDFPITAVAVHEPSLTLAFLSPAEGTLYVFNLSDYRPLDDVLLGKRTESAAALDRSSSFLPHLAITNPANTQWGFASYDLSQNRWDEFPTGFLPIDAAPLNASRGYAVLSQGEGLLYLHDSLGSVTGSIILNGYMGVSGRLPMAVASRDGNDHVLAAFPEFGTYALSGAVNRTLLSGGFIEGFTGARGSGKGLIQPCFVPGGEEFAFLLLDDTLLQIYNRTTFEFKRSISVSGLDWKTVAPFERFCLQPGFDDGTVFIGPWMVWTDERKPPELRERPSTVILGRPTAGKIAGLTMENGAPAFFTGIAGSQAYSVTPIGAGGVPNDAFGSHDGRTYLFCYTGDARVVSATVDQVSPVPNMTAPESPELTVYPNPVSLSNTVNLSLSSGGDWNASACLTVTDLAGRTASRISVPISENTAVLPVSWAVRSPGIYILRAEWGENSASMLLLVIR